MTHPLDGKVALVTGSSSGIGEAIARRFAGHGAKVVVNSHRSVEAGERIAAALPDALYVQADVADEADGRRLVEAAVERYGRLDVLVNNAGTTKRIPHEDLAAVDLDLWHTILDTNLIGPWLLSRTAVPALREAGGCIVNVSSIAGVRPTGSSIPYAVSKAGLNHLTRLLAAVLGPEVRVNAVAPGLVDTPWTADEGWDGVRRWVEGVAPLRRSATPDDVADVVIALATSGYVTGEVVVVDGGLTLRT